ncbi:hypothetical protein ACEWY4_018836 [Coilia grayii]|uniref:CCHC-type domain-containing protein n=1 Tax=Coilia grayii TaxID=363190 RepID=A0ABD1JFL7_9TELE
MQLSLSLSPALSLSRCQCAWLSECGWSCGACGSEECLFTFYRYFLSFLVFVCRCVLFVCLSCSVVFEGVVFRFLWFSCIVCLGLLTWASALLFGSMTASGAGRFESLTRRHGIKINSTASVEECCLVVGEIVGHDKIVSAARMNNAIVLFLETVELVNVLVERGIEIDGVFTSVLPLSTPSKKVILSNVPPFIKDDVLLESLSRYGKVVSSIKKIAISSKQHDLNYVVYATTHIMRCFECGETGHLVRGCPTKQPAPENTGERQSSRNDVPSEEGGGVAGEASAPTAQAEAETVETPGPVVLADSVAEQFNDAVLEMSEVNSQGVLDPAPVLPEDGSLDFDGEVFKTPNKRKGRRSSRRQAKKKDGWVDLSLTDAESKSDMSDCSVTCSLRQSGFPSRSYELQDIKTFLVQTKHAQNVQIDEFFPDVEQFVAKTKTLMAEGGFTNPKIYRLRKILTKLNVVLGINDENCQK